MRVIFCLLLLVVLFCGLFAMIPRDRIGETISAQKRSSGEWFVTRKIVTKRDSGSIEKRIESMSADVLGIKNPERATRKELSRKFKEYDQKRREEALKPRCVIQECHGLDISCGFSQEHQACTMEYLIGDYCRAFTGCEVVDGECRIIKSEIFGQCKDCVSQCNSLEGWEAPSKCERECRKHFPLAG